MTIPEPASNHSEPSRCSVSPRFAVISVDIGGTKIVCAAVSVGQDGSVGQQLHVESHLPTPRAEPTAFYDAVTKLVQAIQEQARACGICPLPLVAVAHPGRFLPDGALARGTAPNLGKSPTQFDGVAPAQELSRRLGLKVFAENDAVAQMRFGLHALLQDSSVGPHLLGQTVVYIGPGTGMGGGVALVDREGAVSPVTDGHFFDLELPSYGDGTLTAEEVFTGPAIARAVEAANRSLRSPILPARAGSLDELMLDPNADPDQRATAERLAREHGETLAKLIETIQSGNIVKVRLEEMPDGRLLRHRDEPDRAWNEEDRQIVRGAKRFILGGFVGSSKGLGPRIREQAIQVLRQKGITGIEIFPIPASSGDAGVLGAARAATAADIQAALRQESASTFQKGRRV